MKKIQEDKKLLVTNIKILENTKRWRLSYKGLTANLYAKIKERSRRNNKHNNEFTLPEFRLWLQQTDIHRLYGRWQRSLYSNDRRPSVDRINPLKGYTFDNMQVITAEENRKKGDEEKIVLWGKPVCQISNSGMVIANYSSIKVASKLTNINKNNISSVLNKKRKTAGGYGWKFGNIYQNKDLLK